MLPEQKAGRVSMHRSFGLDLAGYSSGRSGLAEVSCTDGRDEYQAHVYRNHPFARCAEGRDLLADTAPQESDALTRLLRLGSLLLVDIPVDLQGLPSPPNPVFVWQLTARAVDFAYAGLRPLADRIGAPVARFRNLLAGNRIDSRRLRETYPAASFRCMNGSWKYKNQTIEWDEGQWVGAELAEVATWLGLVAPARIELTDHDVDALVCALTGAVAPNAVLQGDELNADMRQRLARRIRRADVERVRDLFAPENYCLMRCRPEASTHVRLCDWPPRE